ncbi:MAG: restriction endonuclease subunit S [Endomicrobiaceae bacterium]|nr:restriction endonuclease subunit S [Endomicrobiaceae bacterium]
MKNANELKIKHLGIKWFGDIPKCFTIRKIKFLGRLIAGGTPKTENLEYWGGDIPWIPSGMVQNCLIANNEDGKYITRKGLEESATKEIPENSPLIALTGATCANVGLLKFKATANQSVIALAVDKHNDYKYLYYSFLANREQFLIYKAGGAQGGITLDNVKNIYLAIPDISIQKRIADYLDIKTEQIKTFIENKKKLIELLEEQRKSIIYNAITKGLDKDVKTKPSGVEWLGNIPENWKVKKMKFLGDAIIGLTYNPEDVVGEGAGTLVLRSSNLKNNVITKDDNVYVKKEIPENLLTREGDILICSRNGSIDLVGKNAIITKDDENLTFGAFTTIFRTADYKYIHKYFNSHLFKSQAGLFSSSTINQLTTGILNELLVPMPPEAEREKIIEYIDKSTEKINQAIQTIKQEIKLIEEYKKSLIYSAVTGKIKALLTDE